MAQDDAEHPVIARDHGIERALQAARQTSLPLRVLVAQQPPAHHRGQRQ